MRNGNTCNVAVFIENVRSRIRAVIRDARGAFVAALHINSNAKHFLRCLLHVVQELSIFGQPFCCLKLSHKDSLLLAKFAQVDWSLFQIKEKLVSRLNNIRIVFVSPTLNRPTNIICSINRPFLFVKEMRDLLIQL